MKRRVETILRLLAEADGYTTIEHIAQETDAGVRTIHRDLEMLERGLGLRGVRLERRRGYGVRLIDPLPVDVFESGLGGPAHGTIESNERPLMVLVYLISSGDWIKVSELAHAFFVSDSSVRSDLDGLEDLIPEQVTLERQKGVGVRISGDEATLRLLFLSVYPALFPFYALREFDAGEARDHHRVGREGASRGVDEKIVGEPERAQGDQAAMALLHMIPQEKVPETRVLTPQSRFLLQFRYASAGSARARR